MSSKLTSTLTIPSDDGDITPAWIQNATGFMAKPGTISTQSNIQLGFGNLCNLTRVSFTTTQGKEESFLIKSPPQSAFNIYAEFALDQKQKMDQREIEFYSNIKPQLIKLCPELENNLCRYYSSKITEITEEPYRSILVFEDLKPLQYENLNPECSNWKPHLKSILKFCAKFHAAGIALEKKEGKKISEIFHCLSPGKDMDIDILCEIGKGLFPPLKTILEEQNCPEKIVKSYENLSTCWKNVFSKTLAHGTHFPCLIHRDIWYSNVMVTKDPSAPIKVIDWQFFAYRDPAFDISVAILFCLPTNQYNKENVEYFAKYYFKEFLQACKSHGVEYTRGEEEFLQFLYSWGLSFGFCLVFIALDVFKTENGKEKLKTALEFLYNDYELPQFLFKECSES